MHHKSLIVAARELDHPTKTGIVDGHVVLDFPWLSWMEKILPWIACGPPLESWDFDHNQIALMVSKERRQLALPHSLYQTRHCGVLAVSPSPEALPKSNAVSGSAIRAADNSNTHRRLRLSRRGVHPWTRERAARHGRLHRLYLLDAYGSNGEVARYSRTMAIPACVFHIRFDQLYDSHDKRKLGPFLRDIKLDTCVAATITPPLDASDFLSDARTKCFYYDSPKPFWPKFSLSLTTPCQLAEDLAFVLTANARSQ